MHNPQSCLKTPGTIFATSFAPIKKKRRHYVISIRGTIFKNESFLDSQPSVSVLSEEPIPEQMGLKISFWDKNFDRPKKPHLAEIVFLHGDFYYYEADPETQAFKLILKVSYEDAIGKQDQSIK